MCRCVVLQAGELLEVGCEDKGLKFKMKGLVSNANYSVKKGIFMLFINNRLVNSTAIKKVLDQIYQQYLPKGNRSLIFFVLSRSSSSDTALLH